MQEETRDAIVELGRTVSAFRRLLPGREHTNAEIYDFLGEVEDETNKLLAIERSAEVHSEEEYVEAVMEERQELADTILDITYRTPDACLRKRITDFLWRLTYGKDWQGRPTPVRDIHTCTMLTVRT